MMATAMPIRMIPATAAVPYTGFTPRMGMEMMSPDHKMRFSTTADARPDVANANPASGPGTPATVRSR